MLSRISFSLLKFWASKESYNAETLYQFLMDINGSFFLSFFGKTNICLKWSDLEFLIPPKVIIYIFVAYSVPEMLKSEQRRWHAMLWKAYHRSQSRFLLFVPLLCWFFVFLCTICDKFWELGINFSVSSLNEMNFTHSLESLDKAFRFFGSGQQTSDYSCVDCFKLHSTGLIFRLQDVPVYLSCSSSSFLHTVFNWICLGEMRRDSVTCQNC